MRSDPHTSEPKGQTPEEAHPYEYREVGAAGQTARDLTVAALKELRMRGYRGVSSLSEDQVYKIYDAFEMVLMEQARSAMDTLNDDCFDADDLFRNEDSKSQTVNRLYREYRALDDLKPAPRLFPVPKGPFGLERLEEPCKPPSEPLVDSALDALNKDTAAALGSKS